MNLRRWIERLRAAGRLVETEGEVSTELEAASLLAELDGRPVYLGRLKGSALPAAGNLMSTRELMAGALDLEPSDLIPALVRAQRDLADPPRVENAPCHEVVTEPADLAELPVLRHLAGDGGPYVTSAVAVVDDPECGVNLSYHRLMVTGADRATARVVRSRGLDRALQHAGGEIDVAFLVGAPTQVLLAAAMAPPADVDETRIAQVLANTPLVKCRSADLWVPAETEIVLEGRITSERGDEGPFIDLTETLDHVRQEPVVRFRCVTRRRDAVYHALLPGCGDHRCLMGLPREADIFLAVGEVCDVVDVCMRRGGCSWLHAVVRIRKEDGEAPRRAVDAALEAHPSLKLVIVVDEDIDAHDAQAVEWAMATRFQADRGLVVYEDRPSSSLDPSAGHSPGKKARGAKMGIDATRPRPGPEFDRLAYPRLSRERIAELLGETR